MTQRLNTTIQRPVTDFRHYSSVLRADPDVLHAWNMVEKGTYSDPESLVGGLKLSSRLVGGLPLKSYSPTPVHYWQQRGGFMVSHFPAAATNGEHSWMQTIPNPGDLFSVILICNSATGFAEPLAFDYDAMHFHIVSDLNGNVGFHDGGAGAVSLPTASPGFGVWATYYLVFDLANSEVHCAVNGGSFSSAPFANLLPQPDDNVSFALGRAYATATNNQNFNDGSICEFSIVAGDIRNKPALIQATELCNATGYGA